MADRLVCTLELMIRCSESLDPLLSVFPTCVRVQSRGVEQGLLISEAGSSGSLFILAYGQGFA